jgi:hypothetical protein
MRAVQIVFVLCLMLGTVNPVWAQEATPVPNASLGLSRANPVPLGEKVVAGTVELQVRAVLVGPEAVAAVLGAATTNEEPREGSTYVAVDLAARNVGEQPLWLDNDDFALTGDDGLVYRYLGAAPPDPALDLTLAPGDATEGWVAFGMPSDETSLLLLFDSMQLGGAWADRVLALQEGARIPDLPQRVAPSNQDGTDASAAVGFGAAAVTDQWSVELLDVITGEDAFNQVDYRAGALGVGDATGEDGSVWVALKFRVQNVASGGDLAYFPTNAFVLADETGEALLDVATLTPPRPDASGGYYPGASREGWVMFDVPVDYTANIIRFLPNAHTAASLDPRYFSFAQ